MKLQSALFLCKHCDGQFLSQIAVNCDTRTFNAVLRYEVRCPNGCNSFKKLVLVKTGHDAVAGVTHET